MKWLRNNVGLFLVLAYAAFILSFFQSVIEWISRHDHLEPLASYYYTNTTRQQETNTVLWNTRRLRYRINMIAIDINAFPSYRRKVVSHYSGHLAHFHQECVVEEETRLRAALKRQIDALNAIDRCLAKSTPSYRKLRKLRAQALAIRRNLDDLEDTTTRELSSMKRVLYLPAGRADSWRFR